MVTGGIFYIDRGKIGHGEMVCPGCGYKTADVIQRDQNNPYRVRIQCRKQGCYDGCMTAPLVPLD